MNRAEKNIIRAEAVAKAYAALTENHPYRWDVDYYISKQIDAENELKELEADRESCPDEYRVEYEEKARELKDAEDNLKILGEKIAIYAEIAEMIVDKIR